MSKKNYKEQEEREVRLYPEMNQGLEVLNEAGEWVIGRKKEPFTAYPRGFAYSGIIGVLNGNTAKILGIICSFTNRFRNTTITNKMIGVYSGVSEKTVKKAIRELKFYHIISSHYLPGGGPTKRIRRINILRWDTARSRLIKEKKITIGLDNKVVFVIPNPYRKR
ncbi:hypothetical protein ES695_01205 [Candidatus Atribacteria bacterium 1244-E10-H5-B2]|nr:MAG: hypothetical protein ES695_01205 [Candidatus Atribacteria bacterium 1244-E10-H5-B2]